MLNQHTIFIQALLLKHMFLTHSVLSKTLTLRNSQLPLLPLNHSRPFLPPQYKQTLPFLFPDPALLPLLLHSTVTDHNITKHRTYPSRKKDQLQRMDLIPLSCLTLIALLFTPSGKNAFFTSSYYVFPC